MRLRGNGGGRLPEEWVVSRCKAIQACCNAVWLYGSAHCNDLQNLSAPFLSRLLIMHGPLQAG